MGGLTPAHQGRNLERRYVCRRLLASKQSIEGLINRTRTMSVVLENHARSLGKCSDGARGRDALYPRYLPVLVVSLSFDLADAYPVTYGRHIPSHMVFGRHIPSGFWSSYPVTYVRHTGILPTKRTAYSDLVDVASKFIEELTVTKSKRATRP